MRTIEELLTIVEAGDRVFLRGDLNVPLEDGKITDFNRVSALLPTLESLLSSGCVVTVATHLGRPSGVDPNLSTEPLYRYFAANLSYPVALIEEFPPGPIYQHQVSEQSPGSLLILENLRFSPGEKSNDLEFAKKLASGNQFYVNDAFGCCHRAHASVDAITTLLPSFVGHLIQKELAVLSQIKDHPKRPFWVISGGAKVSDKLGVLNTLSTKLDGVICTGGLANTLLHGQGVDVGSSKIEPESLNEVHQLISGNVEMVLPVDFIAGDQPIEPTETINIRRGDSVPDDFSLFDVGPESISEIQKKLSAAETVFWNGPAGVFETPEFSSGTRELAKFLAKIPGKVVVGGGDSAAAVRQLGLANYFHHVSTGGGAALEFLEGKSLPGLVALSDSVQKDSGPR